MITIPKSLAHVTWDCHDVNTGIVATCTFTENFSLSSLPIDAKQAILSGHFVETLSWLCIKLIESIIIFLGARIGLQLLPRFNLTVFVSDLNALPFHKAWIVERFTSQDILKRKSHHEVWIWEVEPFVVWHSTVYRVLVNDRVVPGDHVLRL